MSRVHGRLTLSCIAFMMAIPACSRGGGSSDAATSDLPSGEVTPPAPDPLDLLGVELDTTPAADAEPGNWVQCAGGTISLSAPTPGASDPPSPAPVDPHEGDDHGVAPPPGDAAGTRTTNDALGSPATRSSSPAAPHAVRLCRDRSQAWVDANADEITVVARALNADELIVAGRKARFIGPSGGPAIARVRVPLRPLMGQVMADHVGATTALALPVEITHAGGTVRGELMLETPRVLKVLTSVASGLVFGDEGEARTRSRGSPLMIVALGEESKVVQAPPVPLAAVASVALVTTKPIELPPCSGATDPRAAIERTLAVFERTTGRTLGQRVFSPDGSCDPTSPPPDLAQMARVLADEGLPERWSEPPLDKETRPAADAAQALPQRAALHAWWRPLGLDPNATRHDLEARFGPGVSSTVDDVTLVQWAGGLTVAIESGAITSIVFPATWGKAIDPVRSPELQGRGPLDALVSQTAEHAVATLGPPSDRDDTRLTWRMDAGAWGLSVTCDLAGEPATCVTVTLRWRRPAQVDLGARDKLGFDPAGVAPKDPATLRRLTTFLGLGAASTRADLDRVLGPATSVTPARGGIETRAHGEHVGALVDAKTGTVLEVWVNDAEGREALSKMKLDDPLLVLIGKPPAEVVLALGRPDKLGEGFMSWTLDDSKSSTYVEVRCEGEPMTCGEVVVGWLAARAPQP